MSRKIVHRALETIYDSWPKIFHSRCAILLGHLFALEEQQYGLPGISNLLSMLKTLPIALVSAVLSEAQRFLQPSQLPPTKRINIPFVLGIIGKKQPSQVTEILVHVLSKDSYWPLRNSIITALTILYSKYPSKITPTSISGPLIQHILCDPVAKIRQTALESLISFPVPSQRCFDVLFTKTDDKDKNVRDTAWGILETTYKPIELLQAKEASILFRNGLMDTSVVVKQIVNRILLDLFQTNQPWVVLHQLQYASHYQLYWAFVEEHIELFHSFQVELYF